jgi:hypothetical protein
LFVINALLLLVLMVHLQAIHIALRLDAYRILRIVAVYGQTTLK